MSLTRADLIKLGFTAHLDRLTVLAEIYGGDREAQLAWVKKFGEYHVANWGTQDSDELAAEWQKPAEPISAINNVVSLFNAHSSSNHQEHDKDALSDEAQAARAARRKGLAAKQAQHNNLKVLQSYRIK